MSAGTLVIDICDSEYTDNYNNNMHYYVGRDKLHDVIVSGR